MEFFVTKELELPEALCFILLGLHMVYSGKSYRSENFEGGSFSRRRQFAILSQFQAS